MLTFLNIQFTPHRSSLFILVVLNIFNKSTLFGYLTVLAGRFIKTFTYLLSLRTVVNQS
jgi:hypothetical protein